MLAHVVLRARKGEVESIIKLEEVLDMDLKGNEKLVEDTVARRKT
jgi:hypothetical protein